MYLNKSINKISNKIIIFLFSGNNTTPEEILYKLIKINVIFKTILNNKCNKKYNF